MQKIKLLLNNLLSATGYTLTKVDACGYAYKENLKLFINAHPPTGKVLDAGAGDWGYIKDTFGSTADILTFDKMGTPDVTGDIESLPFEKETFDYISCLDVLEHTQRPHVAVNEMYRVLKPGGTLIASAPFIYELHGQEYGDYWRITEQGWQFLLRDFTIKSITPYGKNTQRLPMAYFIIAKK